MKIRKCDVCGENHVMRISVDRINNPNTKKRYVCSLKCALLHPWSEKRDFEIFGLSEDEKIMCNVTNNSKKKKIDIDWSE